MQENFPKLDRVFQLEDDGLQLTFPATLLDTVQRADIFAEEWANNPSTVRLDIKKNRITVHSSNVAGSFEESARIDYSGEPVTIHASAEMLKDILAETTTCWIDKRRILFKGETDLFHWEYIVARRV